MVKIIKQLMIIMLISFLCFSAQKKKINTSDVIVPQLISLKNLIQFKIPKNWIYRIDGTEFVIYPKNKDRNKIFGVIAAKIANKENLRYFINKLSKPFMRPERTIEKRGKKKTIYRTSRILEKNKKPQIIKTKADARTQWVKCEHAHSEIKGYNTIYFGTVTGPKKGEKVALLVTLTYKATDKIKFKKIIKLFIQSLKVTIPIDKLKEKSVRLKRS